MHEPGEQKGDLSETVREGEGVNEEQELYSPHRGALRRKSVRARNLILDSAQIPISTST